jgi:hypothetical protein
LLAGYEKAVAPIKRAEAAKKELTLTQNVEKGSVAR